jgi:hypothetical protein
MEHLLEYFAFHPFKQYRRTEQFGQKQDRRLILSSFSLDMFSELHAKSQGWIS